MTLPAPDADSLARSQALTAHIRHAIADAGGWIPFSRYMELALYTPGLGYYAAGEGIFGADGDFTTAPEMTPLFGRTLARALAPTLAETGGDLLELGAGTGRLAVDVLGELDRLGHAPRRYYILEISAGLAARQRETLALELPAWRDRVTWLTELPEGFHGAIVANEVFDALPFEVIHWTEAGPLQRGIIAQPQGFSWHDQTINDPALARHAGSLALAPGYISECSPAVPALLQSLGSLLAHGEILIADYGFLRSVYYHPQRHMGTLKCHYRHRTHDDPFFLPGLCDITAHVDFDLLLQAALQTGMVCHDSTTLARFLVEHGILDDLTAILSGHPADYAAHARRMEKLLSPAEMGEMFRVMRLVKPHHPLDEL